MMIPPSGSKMLFCAFFDSPFHFAPFELFRFTSSLHNDNFLGVELGVKAYLDLE